MVWFIRLYHSNILNLLTTDGFEMTLTSDYEFKKQRNIQNEIKIH